MAGKRVGMRAITMQQPFAAAMAHGRGLFTRRGKPTKFAEGGEWVAVHCGSNSEHIKNKKLMAEVRAEWRECPSDAELLSQQKCILGIAHFVDGAFDAREAERQDFFLKRYDCTKTTAWRADAAVAAPRPISYPKGNLQVWHLCEEGFAQAADAANVLRLAQSGKRSGTKPIRPAEPKKAVGGESKSKSPAVKKEPLAGNAGKVRKRSKVSSKQVKETTGVRRSTRVKLEP